jgi:hypothetical protein
LKYAGLLESPTRGRVRISELGLKVLAEKPQLINVKFLKRFPSYCEFIGKSESKIEVGGAGTMIVIEEEWTPLELIDAAYQSLALATPPYSPSLNLIERLWGHLKPTVPANVLFGTLADLVAAFRTGVGRINGRRDRMGFVFDHDVVNKKIG